MADFKRIRGNIERMIENDVDDKEIEDYIASEGVTLKQVQRNMPMYKDVAKAGLSGVVEGVTSIPRLAATVGLKARPRRPGMEDIEDAFDRETLSQFTPDVAKYDPATRTGSYVKAGTGGVASSFLPGASIRKPLAVGLTGLSSGLTGELAAEAFPRSPDAARLAGGLIGGGVVGLPKAALQSTSTSRQVKNATAALTPKDWEEADALGVLAKTFGIDMSAADLLGKKAPGIAAKQLQAEQSQRVAPELANLLKNRPEQVQSAMAKLNAQVGSASRDPAELGRIVAGEAARKVRGAEIERTAQTSPIYQAADSDRIPQAEAQRLLFQIGSARMADKTGAFSPQLNYLERLLTETPAVPAVKGERVAVQRPGMNKPMYKQVPGTPGAPAQAIRDVGNLTRAGRVMRERIELPPFAAEAVDKETKKVISGVTDELRSLVERYSPTYAAANQRYKELTPDVIAKQEGALGAVAKLASPAKQFDRAVDPELMRRETVSQFARDMQRKQTLPKQEVGGDTAYQDLMRYGLDDVLDTSSKKLASGGEEFIGARIARNMRQTPQRTENVMEALRQLPNGKSIAQGYDQLLNVLEATGNRLTAGSRTAFNTRAYEDMTSGAVKDVLKHPTNLGLRPLMNAWDNMNMEKWGRLFADPQSVKKLRKLAMMDPKSQAAADLATSILSSVKSPEDEEAFQ